MPDPLPRLTPTPSIHEFLAARPDPAGRLPEHVDLPDTRSDPGGLRWAPGALDGVFGRHFGGPDDAGPEIADRLAEAAQEPSRDRLQRLLDALAGADEGPGLVDDVLGRLGARDVDTAGAHRVAFWLATTATGRFAVKLGIAVLGRLGLGPTEIGVLRTLGAHEELTLYAAVALSNGLEAPDSELWALAAAVDGWGRIECVDRLRNTADPQIRRWILREGYRNSVMYEYLAYAAATTGGLLDALEAARGEPTGDRELLTAAGEILSALVAGGPAEDLDDYADSAEAVGLFLELMDRHASTLADHLAVRSIRDFLTRPEGWEARAARGWTATRRTAYEQVADRVLSRPEWADRARVGLLAEDRAEFYAAVQVGREVGVDPFAALVARIEADPLRGPWYDAWRGVTPERAAALVDLATRLLPLADVASGPGDELGLGGPWQSHQALDWTLQELRHHPGIGGELLVVGLGSPVVRNRNMSLAALAAWPRAQWPDGAADRVAQLAASDPNDHTRAIAADVLAGR